MQRLALILTGTESDRGRSGDWKEKWKRRRGARGGDPRVEG